MTPTFAKAVDPIFLHVLGLLDRISNGESPDPKEQKTIINNLLTEAQGQLSQKPDDWRLAKYALVSWVDEVLIEAPWAAREWWYNNVLEVDHFESRIANTEFFIREKDAAKLTRRDALEVYYLCVVLGFRGFYRTAGSDLANEADRLDIPHDVESWAQRTSRAIQLGQGRPSIGGVSRPIEGAPPLDGKYVLLGTTLLGVIFAAITATVAAVMYLLTVE